MEQVVSLFGVVISMINYVQRNIDFRNLIYWQWQTEGQIQMVVNSLLQLFHVHGLIINIQYLEE
jgi:hypothetical protein